jgi:hypothetical protein
VIYKSKIKSNSNLRVRGMSRNVRSVFFDVLMPRGVGLFYLIPSGLYGISSVMNSLPLGDTLDSVPRHHKCEREDALLKR